MSENKNDRTANAVLPVQDDQIQFLIAAMNGDLATVHGLFTDETKAIDPNKKIGDQGVFPLFMAAQNGHLDVVNYLLGIEGIDVNSAMVSMMTSLHIAVHCEQTDVVRAILAKKDVQLNVKAILNGHNYTPIHFAVNQNLVEIVNLLLTANAETTIKDQFGLTPLDLAVNLNRLEISSILDGAEQNTHTALIQRMKVLGFKSNPEGICFAYAEVAKICALSAAEVLNEFHSTISTLKQIKASDLLVMREFHEELQLQAERETLQAFGFSNKKSLNETELDQFRIASLKKLELLRKQLSKETQRQEEVYLDILVLFNALELEFQGQDYPHLIEKHSLIMMATNKQFKIARPNTGQIVIALGKNGSLRCKLNLTNGTLVEDKLTKEELYAELNNKYQEFSEALNSRKVLKLNSFIKNILNIVARKGHILLARSISKQEDNPNWVTALIQPKVLEDKGGEVVLASFTGAYKPEEFPAYFANLRSRLRECKNCSEPVALSLHSIGHTISLVYRSADDTWEIFSINDISSDPDEIKREILPGNTNIAEKVNKGFFAKPENMMLRTCASTVKNALDLVNPAIALWLQDLAPMHVITPERAKLLNSKNESWLSVAIAAGEESTVQALLSQGADVHSKLLTYATGPFFQAAAHGHVGIVNLLLDQPGIMPDEKTESGETALHVAAKGGHTEVVKHLLQAGWDPNLTSDNGATPLIIAAQNGHYEVVKFLLQIANIDLRGTNAGISLLSTAIDRQHLRVVQIILQEKLQELNPNEQDSDGETIIQRAAMRGNLDIVNALLHTSFKTKIDVDYKTAVKAPALYWAAQDGHAEMAQALIEAKADVYTTYKGDTIATIAVRSGNINIIKCLIEAETNLDVANDDGWTPILLAAFGGHTHITQALAEAKVDLNSQTKLGKTPVSIAVQEGNIHVLKALIAAQADLNLPDFGGKTALHWAMLSASKQGMTLSLFKPVSVAYEMVQVLLTAGASTDLLDKDGKLPFDYANDALRQYLRTQSSSCQLRMMV